MVMYQVRNRTIGLDCRANLNQALLLYLFWEENVLWYVLSNSLAYFKILFAHWHLQNFVSQFL